MAPSNNNSNNNHNTGTTNQAQWYRVPRGQPGGQGFAPFPGAQNPAPGTVESWLAGPSSWNAIGEVRRDTGFVGGQPVLPPPSSTGAVQG